MTQLFAICKRLTLDLGIQIDWKWKDGERYSMNIVTKKRVVSHRRPNTVWFHLCEEPGIVKSVETESRTVVGGGGNGKLL